MTAVDGRARVQTLVIENFPRPEMARQLSPNGRAHWAVKRKARLYVIDSVTVAAIRSGLQRMRSAVVLHVVYTMPDKRRRDQDNYTTGTLKAAIDTLVNGGWLQGDDTSLLLIKPVEMRVVKGVRALELRFEEMA